MILLAVWLAVTTSYVNPELVRHFCRISCGLRLQYLCILLDCVAAVVHHKHTHNAHACISVCSWTVEWAPIYLFSFWDVYICVFLAEEVNCSLCHVSRLTQVQTFRFNRIRLFWGVMTGHWGIWLTDYRVIYICTTVDRFVLLIQSNRASVSILYFLQTFSTALCIRKYILRAVILYLINRRCVSVTWSSALICMWFILKVSFSLSICHSSAFVSKQVKET